MTSSAMLPLKVVPEGRVVLISAVQTLAIYLVTYLEICLEAGAAGEPAMVP